MVIMLEGISKCGKTSWYERNLSKLRDKYGNVTYFHPHLTGVGEILKQMYFSGTANNEELAAHYLGLHLAALVEIEKLNQKFRCVVVDRTILSTLVINVPHIEIKEKMLSGNSGKVFDEIAYFYYNRLYNLINSEPTMIWFDCKEPSERYASMHRLNELYTKEILSGMWVNLVNLLAVDADLSMEEVDQVLAEELGL